MSDSNEKKVSTENKTDKKPATQAKEKPAKSYINWVVPLVIIVLLVIGGAYSGWHKYQQQQILTDSNIARLSEQIDKVSRAQKYQGDDQQTQLDALVEQQTELKRNFASLLKSSGHLKNDWLLAEAEYLIKLANHRLILEKDIPTAIAALEAADERIREVADPALIEVRKVILEQTQNLRAIEQPDLTGIALQISALKKQIPQLAMKTPDPVTVQQRAKQASKASRVESWSELPAAMWEDLKSLITIRDHSQAVQPLIPPEQYYFLTQNLNLQLEQARLALLKGNNNLYLDSLNSAINWIETHFDIEQQTTQSLLNGLKALTTRNIEPTIPDISQSYKVLQEYRATGFVPKEQQPAPAAKQERPEKEDKKPAPAKDTDNKPAAVQPETKKPATTGNVEP